MSMADGDLGTEIDREMHQEENRWILEKRRCPLCGAELSYVYHGYPIAEYEEYLKSKGVNYILGGCLCFGDDRDEVYHCKNCGTDFSRDLKVIRQHSNGRKAMMTKDPEVMETVYWREDKSWYIFDPTTELGYILTDKAPERAKKAYEKWARIQRE